MCAHTKKHTETHTQTHVYTHVHTDTSTHTQECRHTHMDAVWSALQGEHGTGHAFASGMGSGSGPPGPWRSHQEGQQHSRWGKGGRFGYGRSSSLPRAATGSGATAPGPPCQPLTTSALMLAQHRHSPATRGPEAGGLVSGRLLPQPVGGTGEPRVRPWTLLSWAAPVPRAGVLWSAVGMGPRGGPAERPPGVAGLAWRTCHTHIQLGHPS